MPCDCDCDTRIGLYIAVAIVLVVATVLGAISYDTMKDTERCIAMLSSSDPAVRTAATSLGGNNTYRGVCQ